MVFEWSRCFTVLPKRLAKRFVKWNALKTTARYIVIGFFTILNVVTGVFVNTAIESASADKDIATMRQMQQRMVQMENLRDIFQARLGYGGLAFRAWSKGWCGALRRWRGARTAAIPTGRA